MSGGREEAGYLPAFFAPGHPGRVRDSRGRAGGRWGGRFIIVHLLSDQRFAPHIPTCSMHREPRSSNNLTIFLNYVKFFSLSIVDDSKKTALAMLSRQFVLKRRIPT